VLNSWQVLALKHSSGSSNSSSSSSGNSSNSSSSQCCLKGLRTQRHLQICSAAQAAAHAAWQDLARRQLRQAPDPAQQPGPPLPAAKSVSPQHTELGPVFSNGERVMQTLRVQVGAFGNARLKLFRIGFTSTQVRP
jgi:hypothetical protein